MVREQLMIRWKEGRKEGRKRAAICHSILVFGKRELIAEKVSNWVELKPEERKKTCVFCERRGGHSCNENM
jgi:hypothetical protein